MLRTKEGGVFDEQLWKRDIQGLVSTGLFSSVKYEIKETEKGIELTLIVEEYPQIESIKFTGVRSFKKKELEKIVGIKKGDYCSDVLINNAIAKLRQTYEEKGIYFTDITASTTVSTENRVVLTFNIEEGEKRLYVEKILFSGNKAYGSDVLRRKMKIKQRRIPFIRGNFRPDIL
ncbi:MAG: hypothetical protein N2115_07200, partial [bacterium]|nr:hypothetical protein [bacterium]